MGDQTKMKKVKWIRTYGDDMPEKDEIKHIQKVVDEAMSVKPRDYHTDNLDGGTLSALIAELQYVADRDGYSANEVTGTLVINRFPDEPLILEVE